MAWVKTADGTAVNLDHVYRAIVLNEGLARVWPSAPGADPVNVLGDEQVRKLKDAIGLDSTEPTRHTAAPGGTRRLKERK